MSKADDDLTNLKHDAADTVDEAKHRTQATGERVKRDVAGDSMSLGDKIVSSVKETVHNATADIDKAKRDVRHDTAGSEKV